MGLWGKSTGEHIGGGAAHHLPPISDYPSPDSHPGAESRLGWRYETRVAVWDSGGVAGVGLRSTA
jgi:hypothetical protein